jgi:hypothetical protein
VRKVGLRFLHGTHIKKEGKDTVDCRMRRLQRKAKSSSSWHPKECITRLREWALIAHVAGSRSCKTRDGGVRSPLHARSHAYGIFRANETRDHRSRSRTAFVLTPARGASPARQCQRSTTQATQRYASHVVGRDVCQGLRTKSYREDPRSPSILASSGACPLPSPRA